MIESGIELRIVMVGLTDRLYASPLSSMPPICIMARQQRVPSFRELLISGYHIGTLAEGWCSFVVITNDEKVRGCWVVVSYGVLVHLLFNHSRLEQLFF